MRILVVGGSKGLGQYLSNLYCQQKHQVYVIGRDFSDTYHQKLNIIKADVNTDHLKTFLNNVPCFDMILYMASPWEQGGMDDLNARKLLEYHQTNVISFYDMVAYLQKHAKISSTGLVVVVSSVAGFSSYAMHNPFYSYAKSGVRKISRILQKQLLGLGNIRVTVLTIGGIDVDVQNPFRIPYKDIYQSIDTIYNMSDSTYVQEIIIHGKGDL